MFSFLLGAGTQTNDPWISANFPIIRIVILAVLGVCAIAMVVVTLMQSASGEMGANAITGATYDSYYSKHKGSSKDGLLKRITIWLAVAMAVLAIVYFALYAVEYPIT